MELLLIKLTPLVVIIGIGVALQAVREITPEAINGVKFLIIHISLPAVLFSAFIKAPLKPEYLFLFVTMFLFCCLLYFLGRTIQRFHDFRYGAEFFTGFEFGMVGIALFTSLWGAEKLPVVVLIGLGHEIFIWFVYMPLLEYKNTGKVNVAVTLSTFIRHPILIAIIAGIGMNLLGFSFLLETTLPGRAVSTTLSVLTPITGPLILVVVGYSIRLASVQWKATTIFISLRLCAVLLVGTLAYLVMTAVAGEIDPLFATIFFAFILLPPPFILPLFIENNESELRFFSNAIMVYTLLSFAGFLVLMMV